ncbi:MAG TPA: hypothetical protein VE084_14665 [Burkholderiaceae bacterium]|nr:hypothetical protein [Burkholderiaceae bacterium]
MGYFFEDPNTLAKSITYSGRMNFDEAAGTWQFASGTVRQFSPTAAPLSGSYVGRSSLTGSYAAGSGAAATFGPWTYDVESNSLAVTPELLARHWGGYGTGDVAIAADGTVTGKFVDGHPYGTCTVTGSITLAEPGTKKNRLEASLTFTNTPREGQPACKFDGQKSARAFVTVLQSTDKGRLYAHQHPPAVLPRRGWRVHQQSAAALGLTGEPKHGVDEKSVPEIAGGRVRQS